MTFALLLRRARAQAGLLLAVTATALVALTVLGTCALLLGPGRAGALDAALAGAPPGATAVQARVDPAPGEDAAAVAARAVALLEGALEPLAADSSVWSETPLLALEEVPASDGPPPDGPAFAYLADAPGVEDVARLVEGTWPGGAVGGADGPVPVAVPRAAAEALGLAVGDVLRLGPSADSAPDAALAVRVSGVYAPRGAGGDATPWTRDLLAGAGADPDHGRPGTQDRRTSPAYGPLVVAPGAAAGVLGEAGTGPVAVAVHPHAAGAGAGTLSRVAGRVAGVRTELADGLGETADRVVVRTTLPAVLRAAVTQHGVTGAAAAVAGLLCGVLAVAALLLAGRLLAARRAGERALLADRGAGRAWLLRAATAEAGVVVLVAAVLAVPASLGLYAVGAAVVPVLPPVGAPPGVLLGTVAAGALALLLALCAPTAGAAASHRAEGVRRFARTGADLLLVALAAVVVLRLRGGTSDALRTLAPVLCLVALSVLALRAVPLLARGAERSARRSRRFVLPLAALDVARRPRPAAAVLLLVLAAAGGTFGTSWWATAVRSQGEQAEVRVPAELVASGLAGTPAEQGEAVRAAGGVAALPAVDRVTALGTLVGAGSGEAPTRLLAVARDAPLHGRLPDGARWRDLTAGLPPGSPAPTLALGEAGGAVGLRLEGTADGVVPVTAAVTLVLQDEQGVRTAVGTEEVPLDGRTHELVPTAAPGRASSAVPSGNGALAAVLLHLRADAPLPESGAAPAQVRVHLGWDAPATGGGVGAAWGAAPTTASALALPTSSVTVDREGLQAGATLDLVAAAAGPADLVLSGFPRPGALPVLVSQDLASGSSLRAGDLLEVLVGRTPVPARVVGVAPYLPGAPEGPAVLADLDALSRAALAQAETATLVDGWWVDGAAPGAAAALRDQGADVTVRAEVAAALRDGPQQAAVGAALALLVGAAVLLALVGAVLHAAGSADDRGPEVARLLALGAAPRAVAATHTAQHAVLDVLGVAAGAAVGAATAWLLAPALTVTASGGAPVPPPVVVWPWAVQGPVLAALVVGATVVTLPVVRALVRRATASHLRVGDAA
ncbi:hypothetical protein [Cellulomonas olei]|uniref:hypothetical protein n=1 Tax=Cellulomonas sp. P4 TaxID=3142533 RepID=UPI0031BB6D9B